MTALNKKSSRRTYGGLSEAERVNERRERFLEAGLEILGTVGLRGATVRKVCKEAGLTERYFYESFTDMEDLFCAVYAQQLNTVGRRFLELLPTLPEPLDERIRACLHIYFGVMRNDRMVRVVYIESMAGTARVNEVMLSNATAQSAVTAMLLKQDNPDLNLSEEFISGMAIAISGALSAVAVQWMLGGYKMDQDTLVESCLLLVQGTMKELKSRSSQE